MEYLFRETGYINIGTNLCIMQHEVAGQTNVVFNDWRCHSSQQHL